MKWTVKVAKVKMEQAVMRCWDVSGPAGRMRMLMEQQQQQQQGTPPYSSDSLTLLVNQVLRPSRSISCAVLTSYGDFILKYFKASFLSLYNATRIKAISLSCQFCKWSCSFFQNVRKSLTESQNGEQESIHKLFCFT